MSARRCRNPRCREEFAPFERAPLGLCVSCRYLGRRAFAAGAGAVGIIMAILEWVRGW